MKEAPNHFPYLHHGFNPRMAVKRARGFQHRGKRPDGSQSMPASLELRQPAKWNRALTEGISSLHVWLRCAQQLLWKSKQADYVHPRNQIKKLHCLQSSTDRREDLTCHHRFCLQASLWKDFDPSIACEKKQAHHKTG